MSQRSFFSDEECRQAGFSPPMVETLRKLAEFVDTQERLTEAEATAAALDATVVALDGTVAAADAAIVALDARIDAYDALDPFVRQDQTSAWVDATGTPSRATFATYAGQTISAIPTQAEVQAIDDHVKVLSQRVAGLVNDLRSIGALT